MPSMVLGRCWGGAGVVLVAHPRVLLVDLAVAVVVELPHEVGLHFAPVDLDVVRALQKGCRSGGAERAVEAGGRTGRSLRDGRAGRAGGAAGACGACRLCIEVHRGAWTCRGDAEAAQWLYGWCSGAAAQMCRRVQRRRGAEHLQPAGRCDCLRRCLGSASGCIRSAHKCRRCIHMQRGAYECMLCVGCVQRHAGCV